MDKHVHADLIKAWADGAEIQYLIIYQSDWVDDKVPAWHEHWVYRIKPPKKVVRWLWAFEDNGIWKEHYQYFTDFEVVEYFGKNCQSGLRKLDYTREEFDE